MTDPDFDPTAFLRVAFSGEGDLTTEEEALAKSITADLEGQLLDILFNVRKEAEGLQDGSST